MDREWSKQAGKLYGELLEHLVSGMERMVSSLIQGMPLEALGPMAGMLGGMAVPKQVPLEACYRMLGLSPTASWEQVRQRYRALAKKLHPDVAGPETAHLFALVTAAYEAIRRQKGQSQG